MAEERLPHESHGHARVVERLIAGDGGSRVIEEQVDQLCQSQLGVGVDAVLFRATSVGAVVGVRLWDARRVVVKVHQSRESRETLAEAQRVQRHLYREGFPCPLPMFGPTALGRGFAVGEELVDRGEFCDTHAPSHRRLMAEALAWQLDLTRPCGQPEALRQGWSMYRADGLWPREAHSPIFDFATTAHGADWIDALAAVAKPIAVAAGSSPPVVGHHDWSGKHVRFADERISVVYDWDSLRLGSEAVIVGNAAMTHTTNFDLPDVPVAPTPDEARAFIDEYSSARRSPLSGHQRRQIAACATFIAAYTARCEHALGQNGDNTFTAALRAHGREYLQP